MATFLQTAPSASTRPALPLPERATATVEDLRRRSSRFSASRRTPLPGALVADFRFYDFGAGLESARTPVAGHFLLDRLYLAHLYRAVACALRSAGPAIASAASGARVARKIGRGPRSPRLWRGRATDKIDVKGLTAR